MGKGTVMGKGAVHGNRLGANVLEMKDVFFPGEHPYEYIVQ